MYDTGVEIQLPSHDEFPSLPDQGDACRGFEPRGVIASPVEAAG